MYPRLGTPALDKAVGQQTFVMLAQTAFWVAIKGPRLFMKARFQTYAVFCYLLRNYGVIMSLTVWQKQCLVNANQSVFHGSYCFSTRNRRSVLAVTYHVARNKFLGDPIKSAKLPSLTTTTSTRDGEPI